MDELGKDFESLRKITLSDKRVMEYIEILLPLGGWGNPTADAEQETTSGRYEAEIF